MRREKCHEDWAGGLANPVEVVQARNDQTSAQHVCERVVVLIGIVGPGVPHAESLHYLSDVHGGVSCIGCCYMDNTKVQVVLLVEPSAVADTSQDMVKKVPEIEEPLIFHEQAVPSKVSDHVADKNRLIQRALSATFDVSNEKNPIK
jgi:hypothetical protein